MKKIFCLLLSVICLVACIDDDYPENEFENGDSVVISTDLIRGDWLWYDEEYGQSAIELDFRDSLLWFATYAYPANGMVSSNGFKKCEYDIDAEKNLIDCNEYRIPNLTLIDADSYKLILKWVHNDTKHRFIDTFYKIVDTYYAWMGESVTVDLSNINFKAVEYFSISPNIVTVNEDGTVTFKQPCTTFVIAKDSEGNKVAIRFEVGTSKIENYVSMIEYHRGYDFYDEDKDEVYKSFANITNCSNGHHFNDTIVSYVYKNPIQDRSASFVQLDLLDCDDNSPVVRILVKYQSKQAYLNDIDYMSSNCHSVEYNGNIYFCDNDNFESSDYYIYPFEDDGIYYVSYGKPSYFYTNADILPVGVLIDTYYAWMGESVTMDLSSIGFEAVEYISTNPYIATVDESGTIAVKQIGTTFIIAKDSEGNKVAIRLEVETSKVENYVSMIRTNDYNEFEDADADEVYKEIVANMTNCSNGQHSNETIVSYVHKNPIADKSASFVQLDFRSYDSGGHGGMVHILVKYQSKQAYLNDMDYMSSNCHSVEYNGNLYFCDKDNFKSSNYYIYPFEDDGFYYVSYGKPSYFYTNANILPVGVLIDTYYAWMGESITVDLSNIDFEAVEYISTNPYIATVDESGTIAVKQIGTTFIIAKDSEGNKVAIRLEVETSKVKNYVSMIDFYRSDDFGDTDEVYKNVANITDLQGEHSNEYIVSYMYRNPIQDRSASFVQLDLLDYDNNNRVVRILVKYQSKQAYLNDIDYMSSNYHSVERNGNLYFCNDEYFRYSYYYIYPFEDDGIYYVSYGMTDCFYTNDDISPIK